MVNREANEPQEEMVMRRLSAALPVAAWLAARGPAAAGGCRSREARSCI